MHGTWLYQRYSLRGEACSRYAANYFGSLMVKSCLFGRPFFVGWRVFCRPCLALMDASVEMQDQIRFYLKC
ncbi:MAG: hypothetical protein ACJAWD_000817, partial [Methylophilaceae bacterium]